MLELSCRFEKYFLSPNLYKFVKRDGYSDEQSERNCPGNFICGYFWYYANDGKYTYTHGSNPVMMTMFRSLLPIPIILAVLLIKKIPIKIPAKELGKISVIALIGSTVTSVMLNMSYNYIPVGMSTTLHFVYPTFVSVLCFLFYKEHIDRTKSLR